MKDIITLEHGSGGKKTIELIKNVFYKHFKNEFLDKGDDSAVLNLNSKKIAFTTDSYVVMPIFFNGGDIGKLSICGTVNDLLTSGAMPKVLSCGFIMEEGFTIDELEQIVISMADTAKHCGISIVTGDTKVVQKGSIDKIFINTSGIGIIEENIVYSGSSAKVGDIVIVTGNIGEHGCSIFLERENLNFDVTIKSDCAPLIDVIKVLDEKKTDIRVLRDPTRGGVATTLNEISKQSNNGILLYEEKIPVTDDVRGVCEILGMDPLYMANEGKFLMIVDKNSAQDILKILNKCQLSKNSSIIGEVISSPKDKVLLKSITGGTRILDVLIGEQLPRIC